MHRSVMRATPDAAGAAPAAQPSGVAPRCGRGSLTPWWPLWWPYLVGLALVLGPAWVWLARSTWQTNENGHGPILVAVAAWLVWRHRQALSAGTASPAPRAGWLLVLVGLTLHVLGLSQGQDTLLVAGHLPVLAGIVLLTRGTARLRALWFPLAYMLFCVPLPGIVLEAITGPLKRAVSAATEWLLYHAGYPIARNGVVLVIGQYQLLVADACSGLNSLFTLAALALLLVHVTGASQPRRAQHVALLLAAILPIAFVANVVRVVVLTLVTWHFGDAAGQGVAHGAAGMVLFVVALFLLLALDRLLRRVLGPPRVAARFAKSPHTVSPDGAVA